MNIPNMRLNSLFPTKPRTASNSGYSILDQFINQILPMVQDQGPNPMDRYREGLVRKENQRTERLGRDQYNISRVSPALPQIAQALQESQKPMNTVMQGVSPYQEATLGMRARELESRETLNKEKQGESVRKNIATEEDRARRTAVLEVKLANDDLTESEAAELQFIRGMEKQRQGQRFTTDRDVVQQGNALARIDATGKNVNARQEDQQKFTNERDEANFGRDIKKIDKTFTNRKELEAGKPVSSTQEKAAIQNRMGDFLRKNPEYGEFITLDENGSPLIKEGTDPEVIETITRALEAPREDIKLPSGEVDKDAPPSGSKPGGKWITTTSGKRIYQEPD